MSPSSKYNSSGVLGSNVYRALKTLTCPGLTGLGGGLDMALHGATRLSRGSPTRTRELGAKPALAAAAPDPRATRCGTLGPASSADSPTFPNACAPVSARIPAPTQDPQPSTLVDPLLSRSPPASFPSIFPTRRIPWASQAGSWLSIRPVRRSRPRSVPCRSLGRTGGPRARAG